MTSIENLDEELFSRIQNILPKNIKMEDVKMFKNGLIVFLDKNKKNIGVLGCKTCLGRDLQQNSLGEPTIAGKNLLRAEDTLTLSKKISSIIRTNLWLCPDCQFPIKKLLPNFK